MSAYIIYRSMGGNKPANVIWPIGDDKAPDVEPVSEERKQKIRERFFMPINKIKGDA